MTKTKEGFLLYKAFYEPIQHLNNEDKGKLLDALFKYQIEGSEDTQSSIYPFFLFFKNQFRLDQEKYKEKCKKNAENIRQRWNKENTNEYDRIETNTNNTKHTDKEKDKDKEKENVKENENKLIVQNENHFDEFWTHYTPIEAKDGRAVRKGNKQEAKAEYQKQIKKYTHDEIMQGLKNYLTFCKEKGQLTLQAVRFLKRQTFLDEFNIVIKPPTEAEKSRAILDQYINSIKE
mgnify:CR=1 FL=1